VRDMARSFLFALDNYDRMKGEIFNAGDNKMNFSKEDVCMAIREKVEYYLHFADVGHDIDTRDYVVSYEKLNKLGFHTTVSLNEGIDELIKAAQVIEITSPYSNV
jgi:nucleoside-diphosphate-sugar epimerase